MRMRGHAQHDPAEYVPKDMFEHWKQRDPIEQYEKFLMAEKILDAKSKQEMESKMDALLTKDRDFAEASPMPPPELAEKGVYCTGDDCHKMAAKWERNKAEVTPPRSSVAAVWKVAGFGAGKGSGGKNAPIHFGDTPAAEELADNEAKLAPKTPAKVVANGTAKSSGKTAAKNGSKAPIKSSAKSSAKKPVKASAGKARR